MMRILLEKFKICLTWIYYFYKVTYLENMFGWKAIYNVRDWKGVNSTLDGKGVGGDSQIISIGLIFLRRIQSTWLVGRLNRMASPFWNGAGANSHVKWRD